MAGKPPGTPGVWSPASDLVLEYTGRCCIKISQGVTVRSTAARSAASQSACGEPGVCKSSLLMFVMCIAPWLYEYHRLELPLGGTAA